MLRSFLAPVALLLFCVGSAHADTVVFLSDPAGSTENIGLFSGTLTVSQDGNTLTMTMRNDNSTDGGGYLTAFVFRKPLGRNISLQLTSVSGSTGNFQLIAPTNNQGIAAPPFGFFQFGVGLNGSFLSGGNPEGGIAPGTEVTFTFAVTGDTAGLTAIEFANEQFNPFLLARFRGFNNGTSDKVPAIFFLHIPDE
jgi:hypothetical protein